MGGITFVDILAWVMAIALGAGFLVYLLMGYKLDHLLEKILGRIEDW
jgi:hypothetical protein